jgi:hypothetical protein
LLFVTIPLTQRFNKNELNWITTMNVVMVL